MKSNILLMIACGWCAASSSVCIASELDSLQGRWESRFTEQGRALRVLKIIDRHRETVETYDGDVLVHRHVVTLEEKQAEGMTIMCYGEPEVTHGPRKGQRGKPGAFVSRRFGDVWVNVQGLEADGDTPFIVMQFKRVIEPGDGAIGGESPGR